MNPPFPLYAKSHAQPTVKKPWWMLTDIPFSGYLLCFRGPREWLDEAFGSDYPIIPDEYTGCHATLELDDSVCQIVWIGGDEGSWEDSTLVHELVHAADEVMDRHKFEGSEFRACCVQELLQRIWATRNEKSYVSNCPIPEKLKPVIRKLRHLEQKK